MNLEKIFEKLQEIEYLILEEERYILEKLLKGEENEHI